METFDFGYGSVEAKRHINPDGSTGGWVASTASVDSTCFIGCDARVSGNAKVSGYAQVYRNARVSGYAIVYGNAQVYGDARVYGYAKVSGYARVYGYAKVSGNAQVYGNAKVYEDAQVYGNAEVYGDARVYENAIVYGNAIVSGYAKVSGNAKVYENAHIKFSELTVDIKNDIAMNIKCQTNCLVKNGEVYCYKQVNKDLSSFHDPNFYYEVGKWIEVDNPDISDKSCASGLHFSHLTYWENNIGTDTVYLLCKVMIEDIITVQEGKIRAKKCFVLC